MLAWHLRSVHQSTITSTVRESQHMVSPSCSVLPVTHLDFVWKACDYGYMVTGCVCTGPCNPASLAPGLAKSDHVGQRLFCMHAGVTGFDMTSMTSPVPRWWLALALVCHACRWCPFALIPGLTSAGLLVSSTLPMHHPVQHRQAAQIKLEGTSSSRPRTSSHSIDTCPRA